MTWILCSLGVITSVFVIRKQKGHSQKKEPATKIEVGTMQFGDVRKDHKEGPLKLGQQVQILLELPEGMQPC